MGRIASYYYLSHQSMRHFTDNLNSEMNIEEMLNVLCDSYEFSTLPVRHNEDLLNG